MVWRVVCARCTGFVSQSFYLNLIVVAEVGFEPHDLEGMNLASYRAALLRDVLKQRKIADILQR